MKRNINFSILIVLFAALFFSCERNYETEGISKTTYYPIVTVKGELFYSVPVGTPWSDPGATAVEAGKDIEVVVGGDVVNTNVPGVYTISYTSTNVDGYSATLYRSVGVIAEDAQAIDLSGKYKRNAGAQGISTVKKLGPGFYYSDNVGGVATPADGVYFFHYEGDKLGLPTQLLGTAVFSGTDASVKVGESYSWVVLAGGYGDALRTFIKQ